MKIQRGFSMIEMAITVAIMGILLAAALPSVGDWIRNSRVRNTAESIQNGLQQARMEAVKLNRPVSFYLVSDLSSSCTLSAASGTWVVSAQSPAGKCDVAVSATVAPLTVAKASVMDGGGGATVAALNGSASATTVTFNGFGQIATSVVDTAIRVINVSSSAGTYSRRVEISLGGIGRLCDPDPLLPQGDTRACNNATAN